MLDKTARNADAVLSGARDKSYVKRKALSGYQALGTYRRVVAVIDTLKSVSAAAKQAGVGKYCRRLEYLDCRQQGMIPRVPSSLRMNSFRTL